MYAFFLREQKLNVIGRRLWTMQLVCGVWSNNRALKIGAGGVVVVVLLYLLATHLYSTHYVDQACTAVVVLGFSHPLDMSVPYAFDFADFLVTASAYLRLW